jgi:hypothetical protein
LVGAPDQSVRLGTAGTQSHAVGAPVEVTSNTFYMYSDCCAKF